MKKVLCRIRNSPALRQASLIGNNGEAIFRLAEVQKEIQLRFEDCSKSLFAEVILPLEQKVENDFRNAAAEQKKYQSGHKTFLVPFSKASESMKKFHKKKKSKLGFTDSKEVQLVRTLDKCTEKLNEFRLQGLRLALLEERKCYCFVLSRLCALGSTQMHYHDRGLELLSGQLGSWRQLCAQPNILPRSADVLFQILDKRHHEQMNSTSSYGVYVSDSISSSGSSGQSPLHHSHTPTMQRSGPLSEYALPESPSQSLSRSIAMSMSTPPSGPPPEPPVGPQVQATYAHMPQQDCQLAFNVGDLITLLGEQVDGWQFGHNIHTGMYGWFPLSFTERLDQLRLESRTPVRLRQRAKSISDISMDGLSLCDFGGWSFEHDIRNRRRPRSLHEFSLITTTGGPQLHGGGGSQYFFDDSSSLHSSSIGLSASMHDPKTSPIPSSQLVHGSVGSSGDGDAAKVSSVNLPQSPSMKSIRSLNQTSNAHAALGILPPPPPFSPPPPPKDEGGFHQHASPPVPPPAPPPAPPNSSFSANTSLSSIASQAASVASSMRNNVSQKLPPFSSSNQQGRSLPSVPPRPGSVNTLDSSPSTRQPYLIHAQGHNPVSSHLGSPPPPPPPPPPPTDSSNEER
ncbi:hypothetical protein C0Q70_01466 [Pomacea canaliculata]|uniref:SH3 domain-containing protein n=1 Tax=Pomacea canaliculata TaxID=400727 RepID=A0A2T7PZJ7_POMCA|nr:hypothetical protein C0Q70_01466 [Pomacea canaliculata]